MTDTPFRPDSRQPQCIIALDVNSAEQAVSLVDLMPPAITWYKVGLQLFVREGRGLIEMLKNRNRNVFLDLKFHDIPNTVANAVTSAADMKADMLTLHASGGLEMLRAARHAADSLDSPPGLIAVTALTSLDSKDIAALGIGMQIDSYASFLASQAVDSKMDGVVCSPVEAAMLRKELGPRPLLVTPGIRPAIAADDQKRAASPRDAVAAGSDFLVVGRPVTQADDPRAAAQQILDQISG